MFNEQTIQQRNFPPSSSHSVEPTGRVTRSRAKTLNIEVKNCFPALDTRAPKRKLNNDKGNAAKKRKIEDSSQPTTNTKTLSNPTSSIVLPTDLPTVPIENVTSNESKDSELPSSTDSNNVPSHSSKPEYYSLPLNDSSLAKSSIDQQKAVVKIEFCVDEIVWAKIKGFSHWPAKIRSFPSNKMAVIIWFNDYRKTKLYRTQLFKFLPNFDEFSKKFNDTVGLETAAKEALFCFGQNLFSKN